MTEYHEYYTTYLRFCTVSRALTLPRLPGACALPRRAVRRLRALVLRRSARFSAAMTAMPEPASASANMMSMTRPEPL